MMVKNKKVASKATMLCVHGRLLVVDLAALIKLGQLKPEKRPRTGHKYLISAYVHSYVVKVRQGGLDLRGTS
jgi:hypothetical protein